MDNESTERRQAENRADERRQQAFGLTLLALAAIVFSLWRAGFANTFVHRWWWPF